MPERIKITANEGMSPFGLRSIRTVFPWLTTMGRKNHALSALRCMLHSRAGDLRLLFSVSPW